MPTPAVARATFAIAPGHRKLLRVLTSVVSHNPASHPALDKLYTRIKPMPDAIWIDRDEQLTELAHELRSPVSIGLDTEFLRERAFFPKLCLLQISAGGKIWCIDTLSADLGPLVPVLTAAATPKVIHAARQDLEAFYLTSGKVISPV